MTADSLDFPALAVAARELNLYAADLAEAVLSGMDAGFTEQEAVTMTIIEVLQRRGAYRGRLNQAVDDGTIFQMTTEGRNDVHEGKMRSDEQRPRAVRAVGTSGGGALRVRGDSRKISSQPDFRRVYSFEGNFIVSRFFRQCY